jgi:hypothetical protein
MARSGVDRGARLSRFRQSSVTASVYSSHLTLRINRRDSVALLREHVGLKA